MRGLIAVQYLGSISCSGICAAALARLAQEPPASMVPAAIAAIAGSGAAFMAVHAVAEDAQLRHADRLAAENRARHLAAGAERRRVASERRRLDAEEAQFADAEAEAEDKKAARHSRTGAAPPPGSPRPMAGAPNYRDPNDGTTQEFPRVFTPDIADQIPDHWWPPVSADAR